MKPQYRHMTEQERWAIYGRLKREYYARYTWQDPKEYEAFIKRITDELGL